MTRWSVADAVAWLTPPLDTDDKYSRGVLGLATGSIAYPGAAVLGVEAALRTGVGMVRYVGPAEAGRYVLARRPEAVLGTGRVNAWLTGSGIPRDVERVDDDMEADDRLSEALASGAPVILDAAAIGRAPESIGPAIVTPHAGELATLLGVARDDVLADPIGHARQGAAVLGAAVLLKGATTHVVDGSRDIEVAEATPWLATAGAGDALGGVLGALVAARAARAPLAPGDLVGLGATAAFIHGRAARLAADADPRTGAGGHPFTILDLCAALPDAIRSITD